MSYIAMMGAAAISIGSLAAMLASTLAARPKPVLVPVRVKSRRTPSRG